LENRERTRWPMCCPR